MLEFVTREIHHPVGSIEAACLVSEASAASVTDPGLIKDDVLVPLPSELVVSVAEAIERSAAIEKAGYGVDCSAFGIMVLGGVYNPVPKVTYQRGLYRRIEFGRWWEKDEILRTTPHAELAQFILWQNMPLPRHTAIKLPGTEGEYLQKMGHDLPVTLCDAFTNFRFHRANRIAGINSFTATFADNPVLTYNAAVQGKDSVAVYEGFPG